MGTPFRRISVALLAGVLALEAGAVAPASSLAFDPDTPSSEASVDRLGSAPPGPQGTAGVEAVETAGYDTFNRVVSNPFWGFSSSGFSWQTDNVNNQCTGYTSSVNGQNGVMTGAAGANCAIWGSLLHVHHPGVGNPAVWKGASWTFTAEIKISAADNSVIRIGFLQNFTAEVPKYVSLRMSPSGSVGMVAQASGASGSVPFSFEADTWYELKWVNAWGDQQRVKVWPLGSPEPTEWLLVQSLAGESIGYLEDGSFGAFYDSSTGPTSSYFENFSFGPAPILPDVPPPPGTEDNPPYENQADGGDPVSTYTGTFSDTQVDVSIPGRGPAIRFARVYNSNDTRVTPLGAGWTHSYNVRLVSPGDGTDDVVLIGPQGRSDRYVESGGAFIPPTSVHRTLVHNADETYTATDRSQLTWSFDPSGKLTQIRDRFGNVSSLVYNGSGQLTSISDPAGRGVLTLGYTSGKLTSVTDWAAPARVVSYQYDANGRLWKVTDREGETTTFAYDGTSQRLATITDARSNVVLVNTYDAQGRVATQQDARGLLTGETTTFEYVVNPDGTRQTTITAPPTSLEPSFSPSLTDSYDADGWLVQRVTRPRSTDTLTQLYTYDVAGNRTSVTDARGHRTDFCYDVDYAGNPIAGEGDLTRRIDPAPTTGANRPVTLVSYDARHNVIETVAPNGVPSGGTVTCATDLSALDPAYSVDFTFDAAGAALLATTSRFTDPELGLRTAVTKYEYGDAANPGLVTRVIPPRGNTGPSPDYAYATSFSYYTTGSNAGLLRDATDPLGNQTSYAYDAVGRLTSTVDPIGNASGGVPAEHTTSLAYDNEDRLRFRTLPAPLAGGAGLTDETRYDAVGNPTVRIDANGQVTTYAYDPRNSLASVTESAQTWTDPANQPPSVIVTEYAYDAGGNLTRITRASGDSQNERVTEYAYDGRGLLHRETQYPSWPSTSGALVTANAYDANGNRLTTTDPLGQVTTFAHDALNRLTDTDYSDSATPGVAYVYDANGNRTSMVDGTGTTTYAYDEADRPIAVTSPGSTTVGYRYDLDGYRTTLIYPDDTAVDYTLDKAGRLTSLTDWASRSVAYDYFPDGSLETVANPDGSSATYGYDNARRLVSILDTSVDASVLNHFGYGLDGVGNVTSVGEGPLAPVGPVTTARVSLSSSGAQVPGASGNPSISGDGRYVAFDSGVSQFVAGDTNGLSDVFIRDRAAGTTERVSVASDGTEGSGINGASGASVSANGRYVAFSALFDNLVAGDTNDTSDVFVHDRQTHTTTRVSVSSSGVEGNGYSSAPHISTDGRYVVFTSQASNLVAGDSNKKQDVFVYDRQTGTISRVSVTSAGSQVNGHSWSPTMSPDGRFIAFSSDAKNLVVDDRNRERDVFLHDRTTGTTVRVSVGAGAAEADGASDYPSVSADGSLVAFESVATNLVAGDTAGQQDLFIRDVAGGATTRVSVGTGGVEANGLSDRGQFLADGSAVVFRSLATNLVEGDTNGQGDIFQVVVASLATTRVSLTSSGSQANDRSMTPAVSGDGLSVAFWSAASNLVPGDTNAQTDLFVRGPELRHEEQTTYSYDGLYRLIGAEDSSGTRSYSYDPVGNRLTNGATVFTYDRADRIASAGGTPITVDANGNLIANGSDTFAYDQANRLGTAAVDGTTETYEYDGNGMRFSRQVGSDPATRYVTDVAGGLPVTISDGTRKYVYGLGLAYAESGSTIEVYHTDRLGSVRSLTNGSGAEIATYDVDEWGVLTAKTGASSQPFGFTGEPTDVTELLYLRARYYDPVLGRFLSRDTWAGSTAAPQSLARYVYVTNNPVTRTDPSGHCGVDIIADVGFVAYDVYSLVFGPEKEYAANLAALGADLGAAALPCATGAGFFVRGGVHFYSAGGKILEGARAIKAAATKFGLDYNTLRKYIEQDLKKSWGLGPADNVRIKPNGDIIPPVGEDVLGNVFDILE